MSQIFNLYRLQQLDSQLDKAYLRLAEIKKILSQDSDVREANRKLQVELDKLEELSKNLAKIERDVENQKIKIEQNESSLYGGKIRNPKELNDLEKEVASLKKYLTVLEERQLEAMIAVEEQTEAVEQARKFAHKVQNEFAQRNTSCLGEKQMILKEVQRLEKEKTVTLDSISPEFHERYQTIRKQKKGIAVTRISQESEDKTCATCGTKLTLGMVQDSRLPDRLTLCPSCGRILYGG